MPTRYKGLIERVYGKPLTLEEKPIQTDGEKERAVHVFMDKEGDRVVPEKLQEGELYATLFEHDGIRIFRMPCKGSVSYSPDTMSVYADYYEIDSASNPLTDERVVREGSIRIDNYESIRADVYHLNGHSRLKGIVANQLKPAKSEDSTRIK